MKNILERFFKSWNDEEFEDGAVSMEKSLNSLAKKIGDEEELEKLRVYCASFLRAKHIVEISYSYTEARALYKKAGESIRSMKVDIFVSLAEFADMQAAILKIDRGIYTGYAPLMSSAAKELKEKTESILRLLGDKNKHRTHPCFLILKTNLAEKVREDKIYADAIIVVAELYLERWNETMTLETKLEQVQDAVHQLEEAGNERLASDLAPHIHVIKRFADRRVKEGKLFIKNGEVAFYYYASLDYRIRTEFNDFLGVGVEDNSKLEEILGSVQMVSEEMSDIWSGLASLEFIDTYKFRLASIKIDGFREIESFEADVELKYYTMGLFEIKISFLIDNDYLVKDNEGLSLSGLRHLQSLGTPFSLDEKIVLEELEENYQYIAEYADIKFQTVGGNIIKLLKNYPDTELIKEGNALTYNTEQNRFTLVRINKIVESFGSHEVCLRSQDFKNHFQYKALVMPVREVRSAIDNWIMYDARGIDENLAGIRYNESEWLSMNLHQGVVALLEQPVWVFDQAIESIEVASAVLNLLSLSNIQAATQLKNLNKSKENIKIGLKAKELKTLKGKLESEINQLDEFKLHLTNLLETVEAGSIMTYADHTIFMERVFKTIALDRQNKKAISLQIELKDKRAKSMETIKKINDAIVYSQQKMIKLVVSIASVFIALGSLADMFQLWSNSKVIKSLGFSDPDGDLKLFFVLTLAITSTAWLIYDNYIRDKKE